MIGLIIGLLIWQGILTAGLLGMCLYIIYVLFSYVKPDTTQQLKGTSEAVSEMKQFISEERRKRAEKISVEDEIKLLNKVGVE